MNDEPARPTPAALPTLCYVSGLALAPVLTDPYVTCAGALAVGVLLLCHGSAWRVRGFVLSLLTVTGLFIGADQHETSRHDQAFVRRADPLRFVTVTGKVRGEWQRFDNSFRLAVDEAVIRSGAHSRRVHTVVHIYLNGMPPPAGASRLVTAEGFLKLSERGRILLSVKSPRLISLSGNAAKWKPSYWNRRIVQELDAIESGSPACSTAIRLVQALALGHSDDLPDEVRDIYREGGTYHLLVFSGMQIAFAAALLVGLLRWLGRPRIADWALLILSLFAPLFAGNEPSVGRSSWMIGLYALSRILHRPTSIENLFFVSALIRLLVYPAEIADAGFALTYAAAGGLILVGRILSHATGASSRISRTFIAGAGAELAIAPITLFFFHQYVALGSVVTLVLAPVLGLMLTISFIVCGSVFLSAQVTFALLWCIDRLEVVAVAANRFASDTLGLSGMAAAPPFSVLIAGYGTFLLFYALVRNKSWRVVAMAALFLPLAATVWIGRSRSVVPYPQIEFLDVGQGDSILVRNKDRSVLIDGGGSGRRSDFGKRILLPMLLDRGVRRLDAVAMTHPHPDHCAGLSEVVSRIPVGEVWISKKHLRDACGSELALTAARRSVKIVSPSDRHPLRAADLSFEPLMSRLHFKRNPENNTSVVYRIRIGDRRVLLTGDVEREAERSLVDEHPDLLGADVLKVAHHGSRSSTGSLFLQLVQPRIAVISCGRRNNFGHPAPEILRRLQSSCVRIHRTDRDGTIKLTFRNGVILTTDEFDTPR